MTMTEYSQWMSIAAVVCLVAILIISRIVRRTVGTKKKVQKGALIFAITVSSVLLVWGILYEVMR